MAEAMSYPRTPISPIQDDGTRRIPSDDSLQKTPPQSRHSVDRKPLPILPQPDITLQDAPASPVSINPPRLDINEPETASVRNVSGMSEVSPTIDLIESTRDSIGSLSLQSPNAPAQVRLVSENHSRASSTSFHSIPQISPTKHEDEAEQQDAGLHYHGFEDLQKKVPKNRASQMTMQSTASSASSSSDHHRGPSLMVPGARNSAYGLQRPASTYTLGTELRGRNLSPLSANGSDTGSPQAYARDISTSRRSPAARPMSYMDLLNNVPYNQQIAPAPPLNNSGLQSAVGKAASLMNTKKTLEMYKANVKKTQDAAVQYEFAIFMVNASKDCVPGDGLDPAELIHDAKVVLQRLSDRAYPFAQYYLADGYFSGLFNKNKPDYDRAFPLFVAASKHGHAESSYRAALCYEFGWGTAKAYPKAVQFYRNAASRNHPGAATRLGMACLKGDMGLGKNAQKEGIRWLKRAQEVADFQYNSAPYELGLMHLTGFGDEIFRDEIYAAQLLTQAAELGHGEANFLMGQAYENGLYGCPKDAALSVHFYNGAATRNVPEAMMALCAWYMVGAEPVLEKDEGLPKAEYAVGYFTEMGIGCRRDPLEANVWYVRAADQGNDMARQRLQIIRSAAAGETGMPMERVSAKSKDLAGRTQAKDGKKKVMGIF
ncbi:hypothetical protein MRB53_041422 [Persea americana]|nr:hypothetical protein MRB53_041422 [Persea americana]